MNAYTAIPSNVSEVFEQIKSPHRETLLQARALIFDVAATDARIGPVEETLRWGEPAYITARKKTGSTIRLGIERTSGMPAVFFNCKTTLVEGFRQQFGPALRYSKNRAVLLDQSGDETRAALQICIAAALSYHLRP